MTAKTTRNTKNADRFEALHILRSIAALTARNKTGTRAADENAPRVGRDGSKNMATSGAAWFIREKGKCSAVNDIVRTIVQQCRLQLFVHSKLLQRELNFHDT